MPALKALLPMLVRSTICSVVLLLAGNSVAAQQVPDFSELQPPVVPAIDERGVNLSTGYLNLPDLDLSIGSDSSGLSRFFNGNVHNFTNTIEFVWYPLSGNGDDGPGLLGMHASLDGSVFRFIVGGGNTKATSVINGSGSFRQRNGSGELVCNGDRAVFYKGNVCTLYLGDGTSTEYPMGGTFVDSAGERRFHVAYAVETVRPDGEVAKYYGKPTSNFTVSSSLGWLLKMEGSARRSDTASIVGINTAQEYCDPEAISCSVSGNAPKMSSAKSGSQTILYKNGTEILRYIEANISGGVKYTFQYPSGFKKIVTFKFLWDYQKQRTMRRVHSVQIGSSTWTYDYNANYSGSANNYLETTLTNPDGATRVVRTSRYGIEYIKNENGREIRYFYNEFFNQPEEGRLERITRTDGPNKEFEYDSRNNITQITEIPTDGSVNLITAIEYPAACNNRKTCNKPSSITTPNGLRTEYAYDPNHGGVLAQTEYTGSGPIEVRYSYSQYTPKIRNASGVLVSQPKVWRLTKVSSCMMGQSNYCVGTVDERIDGFSYGTNNILLTAATVKRGDGTLSQTNSYSYNYRGQQTAVDGPISGAYDKTFTFYDSLGRKRGTIGKDPDGSGSRPRLAIRYNYNGDGRINKVEEGTASGTTSSALESMSVSSYKTTSYSSTVGLPVVERRYYSGSLKRLTQKSYDNMLRLQCEAQRLNPSVFGSIASTSACSLGSKGPDGNDRIMKYEYSDNGQVESVTEAYGTPIARRAYRKVFNTNGAVKYQYDGKNNKTAYEYDGFNRLVSTCYPYPNSGGSTNYSDCEIINYDNKGVIESRVLRDGQTINFEYDLLGRVVETWGAVTQSFTYNNFGDVVEQTNNGTTETREYNSLSWLLRSHQPMGSVGYDYDAYGRRTKLTYPDNFYIDYFYNYADETTKISTSSGSDYFNFGYDNLARRTSISRSNGVTSNYGYDNQSRLTSIKHGTINTVTLAHTSANQIKKRTNSSSSFDYVPAVKPYASYSNNALNRISSVAGVNFGYDGRGNMTGDNAGAVYTYNPKNFMTTHKRSGVTTALTYDAEDRLLSTSKSGNTTKFLYDGSDLIAEYSTSGTVLRRYVHGLGDDEPLLWYEGAGFSSKRFLHADNLGSIIATTSASGGLLNANRYDAYGKKSSTNSSYASRFSYTGQTYISEIGLYYYKARMYNQNLSRFMQADPIGYEDQMNLYAYVRNDPLNNADPTGLHTVVEEVFTTDYFLPPLSGNDCNCASINGDFARDLINSWRSMQSATMLAGFAFASTNIWWMANESNGDEKLKAKPKGTMPADKGAEKWGRKNGVGAKEGRRRFHDIKQDDGMSNGADDYWVDPESGDVYDPMGDVIGNLDYPY